MSEEQKWFDPVTTQEEFDKRIQGRLSRQREKWEKSGKDAEAERVRKEWETERRERGEAEEH